MVSVFAPVVGALRASSTVEAGDSSNRSSSDRVVRS